MYAIITLEDERSLEKIEWSDDGQLLAVSTPKGTFLLGFFQGGGVEGQSATYYQCLSAMTTTNIWWRCQVHFSEYI
jgi:hypothetical protein